MHIFIIILYIGLFVILRFYPSFESYKNRYLINIIVTKNLQPNNIPIFKLVLYWNYISHLNYQFTILLYPLKPLITVELLQKLREFRTHD